MKRFLPLFFSLCLCISLIPSAFAGEIEIVPVDEADGEAISVIDPVAVAEEAAQAAERVDNCVPISVDNFPDEVFRTYIKQSFDTDGNNQLNMAELEPVKSISVGSKGITSLQGIEYFTKLEYLYCASNSLSTLDVRQNTALTFLNCADNHLSKLDISKNTKLYFLSCENNHIAELDISNCPTLLVVVENGALSESSTFNVYSSDEGSFFIPPATKLITEVTAAPTISTQPTSTTAAAGNTAKFSVKAAGTGLSYQWQYRMSSSDSWKSCTTTGAKTATLSVMALSYRSGYQYRCAVKNSAGTAYSTAATLTIAKTPSITAQPKSTSVKSGTTATFTVAATGGGLSYQWQYRTSSSDTWKSSTLTGAKTTSLSVKAETYRSGYQYRCKVTNAAGTAYSNAATLTVLSAPAITTQPVSKTANEGATAKFTVAASGGSLSYQWQYRTSSSDTWKESTTSGCKTAALSITAEAYRNGYQYRCKVKNTLGTVYSKAATLKVNRVEYRALLVGEVNFSWETATRNRGDVQLMESMLKSAKGPTGGSYSVTCRYDLDNTGIMNAISSTFSGADSNDVSLFFIATHGIVDVPSGVDAGAMVTITSNGYEDFLTMSDLASCLKEVPGKVIVLIGSCGSGAAIVQNGVVGYAGKDAMDVDDAFNAAVVNAFAALDEKLPNETGDIANTGEFRNSKFYVMTAAAHQESSWGSESRGYNYFTYYFANGASGSKPADANGNGSITLLEMYNYVKTNAYGPYNDGTGDYYQHVQVYPANSSYVLFK